MKNFEKVYSETECRERKDSKLAATRLTQRDYDKLEAIRARLGCKMATVVRMAIVAGLEELTQDS